MTGGHEGSLWLALCERDLRPYFLYIGGVELDALAGFDTSLQGGGSGPVQESTRLGDIVRRSGPRAHGSPVSMRSWRGTACPARRASA
jgi:hypothetical protein